jgi:hypothetical protein
MSKPKKPTLEPIPEDNDSETTAYTRAVFTSQRFVGGLTLQWVMRKWLERLVFERSAMRALLFDEALTHLKERERIEQCWRFLFHDRPRRERPN